MHHLFMQITYFFTSTKNTPHYECFGISVIFHTKSVVMITRGLLPSLMCSSPRWHAILPHYQYVPNPSPAQPSHLSTDSYQPLPDPNNTWHGRAVSVPLYQNIPHMIMTVIIDLKNAAPAKRVRHDYCQSCAVGSDKGCDRGGGVYISCLSSLIWLIV